ncbi:hypothetical protein KXD93_06380 [Mucilaginibacter sp. BJC16-A38]|uniref:hypothetical protein n=1 Tax=Mucilaginibacter phenanthrenivorans TaxID=1234842 RepID=UPI0021571C63|nr:hypothetical protein [Mucilaginibacter phenanthrenivorans]MCR8557258.1 hypothetical protein [Mucilaginibacter phenanthrenivorans]
MKNTAAPLPQQQTGRETNFTHSETFDDLKTAHTAFKESAERLLTVNNWHEYTGTGSAKFTLCNNLGDELFGFAAEGFYISIDLPGPGPDAGGGLEWVMIEKIETDGDAETAEEYITMTARPVPDPKKANPEIAHFYTDASTNTFVIRRDGRTLSVGAYGRNEVPNNQDVDLHDKIRNTAIGLMARVGLSGVQWQRLVDGLITYKAK